MEMFILLIYPRTSKWQRMYVDWSLLVALTWKKQSTSSYLLKMNENYIMKTHGNLSKIYEPLLLAIWCGTTSCTTSTSAQEHFLLVGPTILGINDALLSTPRFVGHGSHGVEPKEYLGSGDYGLVKRCVAGKVLDCEVVKYHQTY